MAIPRKAETRPNMLERMRTLPKGTLASLTLLLFCSSFGVYYLFSDLRKKRRTME